MLLDISFHDTDFLTTPFNLWFSLIVWCLAAGFSWYGARRGMPQHLVPRVVLALGATFLAASYALDILLGADDFAFVLNLRRPSGWVVGVGIAWSAWTGIRAGRDMEMESDRKAAHLVALLKEDREKEL